MSTKNNGLSLQYSSGSAATVFSVVVLYGRRIDIRVDALLKLLGSLAE
jgi:hypothetical protein